MAHLCVGGRFSAGYRLQDFDQTRDDTRTTSPDYHSSELHKTDWTPTSTNQPTRRASVPMARTEHTIHVPSAVRPSSYNVYQTLVELQRQRQLGQGQYQMGLNHWGGSGTGDPAPTNMTQGISSQSKVPGKEFAMTTTSWNAQPASKVKSISADRASFPHTAALTHAAQNAWAAELLKKASCITARGSLSQVHTTNHSAPASWDPQSVKNMNNMLSSSGNIPQTRPLSSHSAAAVGCKSRGRAVDDLHGAQEIFPPAKYATLSETEMPFTMVMELRVRMAREKRNKQHAQVQAAEARNEV